MSDKKSFQLYMDYKDMVDALSNEEAGQLFKAVFAHEDGEDVELGGALKGIYILLSNQLDRDRKKYEKKCKKNRANAEKRWNDNSDSKPNDANACERMPKHADTDTDKDTDTDIKGTNVPNGAQARADIYAGRSFSQAMRCKLDDWLKYKKERRQNYKPTGLKAFLTEVENKLKDHSEADVIALINECMANNWQGIAWDKLKSRASPNSPPTKINPFFEEAQRLRGVGS